MEDAVVTKKKSPVPFIIIGIVLAVAVIAGPGPLLVYLKGADLSTLPESFLKYIDYDASMGKLPCYGLYNPDGEGYGFEGKYTGENADGG